MGQDPKNPKKAPVRQEMRAIGAPAPPAPNVAGARRVVAPIPARSLAPRPKPKPTKTTLSTLLAKSLTKTKNHKDLQKRLLRSDFAEDENTAYDALLGRTPLSPDGMQAGLIFDGVRPAPGVTERNPLAIKPPFTNSPEARTPQALQMAIDQFAVGHNPRYLPDGPHPRAHIFVWDVSRALEVEIPHFVRRREQSLAQTCLWMREGAAAHGWVRVTLQRGVEHAATGGPVIVVPRDIKLSMMAVLRPFPDATGKPVVAAAGRTRGNALSLVNALGVPFVDCYVHV